jgi:hypothetical protein
MRLAHAQHGRVAKLSVRYLYRDPVMPTLRIHPIAQSQRAIAVMALLAERDDVACRVSGVRFAVPSMAAVANLGSSRQAASDR